MAPRILIFSIAMGADYSFYVKSIATYASAFLAYNNSVLARVGYAMLGEMHYSSWWFLCVEQVEDLTPEKYASAFSQMIFAWVDPLMRAGWKKQLYPADLWSLQVNFSQSDFSKAEKISEDSLDSILSPSPSVKIQIIGRKVYFR